MRRGARSSRIRLALAVTVLLAAVLAAGAGAAGTDGTPPPCRGGDLATIFRVVPGSAGAGSISYTLQVRNLSAQTCFVTGLPNVRLLDRLRRPLPTHVVPAQPGATTAVRVDLAPRHYAAASARFSPDVPGVGEGVEAPCEPKAFYIRVRPQAGGAGVIGMIRPATRVCERGRLVFSVFVAGRTGPQPA
jgi:Domain of unknown function (DUF4232)